MRATTLAVLSAGCIVAASACLAANYQKKGSGLVCERDWPRGRRAEWEDKGTILHFVDAPPTPRCKIAQSSSAKRFCAPTSRRKVQNVRACRGGIEPRLYCTVSTAVLSLPALNRWPISFCEWQIDSLSSSSIWSADLIRQR